MALAQIFPGDYQELIEIAKAKGIANVVWQDAFAVATLRMRSGIDTMFEEDGFFPLVKDGKLVEKPLANKGIYHQK